MAALRRGRGLPGLVVLLALLTAGCGNADSERATLKIAAASSLRAAFQRYGAGFDRARTSFSFAGSDELAAQIRQGLRPDVFASANTKLPLELLSEGHVERPVEFAANRLVVAVPAGGDTVRRLSDLQGREVRIAVGAPGVPVGAYTRQVIARMGGRAAEQVLDNIRSAEPDVAAIAAKVGQGAVDAGFVYSTDVKASDGRLTALELPDRLQPNVIYAATVVRDTAHAKQARRFIEGLSTKGGREALRAAGFEPPGR